MKEEQEKKNQIFIDKLLYHFNFLIELEFELKYIKYQKVDDKYKKEIPENKEFNETDIYVNVYFVKDNLEIIFKYFAYKPDKSIYNLILFKIINYKVKTSWDNGMIDFAYFLKDYKPNYNRDLLNYSKLEGSFNERIDKILIEIKKIFKEDLFEVIEGNKWFDCQTQDMGWHEFLY